MVHSKHEGTALMITRKCSIISYLHNQYPSLYVTGEVVERLVELQRQIGSYAVPYTVDVLPQSTLQVQSGDLVRLVFNVTNHQPQPVRLTFTCQVRNYQFSSPPLFITPPV
jgi:hypothetical protein